MVTSKKSTPAPVDSLLPLPAATFHIMLVLRDGERHGYAIMKEVEELSEGEVRLGPGTLYGTLKRLLGAGIVREREHADPEHGHERRRYYQLTPYGLAVARAEARRLGSLVNAARQKRLLGAKIA